MKKQSNKFPNGWNESRVQRVRIHYEKQTSDDAAAEDEAAWHGRKQSTMSIPVGLLPEVRRLIAQRQTE